MLSLLSLNINKFYQEYFDYLKFKILIGTGRTTFPPVPTLIYTNTVLTYIPAKLSLKIQVCLHFG
jgi:hypothetical protein